LPFNILLFPLVGGYIFATNYYRSKTKIDRSSGYKLLFEVVKFSIGLLAISSFIIFKVQKCAPILSDIYHNCFVPVEFPHTGKGILALGLGYFLPIVLNRPIHKTNNMFAYLDKVSKLIENELESLIYSSIKDEKPVMLCMRNRKVYVGFVINFQISNCKHITMIPFLSGYRNNTNYSIDLNVDYISVCEEISNARGETEDFTVADLEIVLCADDIERASLFDKDVWDTFHSTAENSDT